MEELIDKIADIIVEEYTTPYEQAEKIVKYIADKYQTLQLQQTGVIGSYSEKDVDNAYDKGFKDAMLKYRTDL